MARQVTADTSPEEIEQIADEYQAILSRGNLSYSRDRTVDEMKRRAAQLNKMTVPEWEAHWAAKSAAAPAPTTPAPAPTKAKAKTAAAPKRAAVVTQDPKYFWLSDTNRQKGRTWIELRRQLGIVQHMLVVGPSGCGKTEGMRNLASEFGLPFYKVDCASITTIDKWVGHKDVIVTEKGPETTYVLSQFLRWISADGFEPGIVLLDEINRLHPSMLNILIPVLDGSESVWVPELGINVDVHKDTLIAATANIGMGFSGTYGLDIALHDRFGVMMEQTFPPQDEEILILQKKTGIEQAQAKMLVDIATQTRRKAEDGTISKPVSTRALIDTGHWVQTGMSIMDAAESTFVLKYPDDGKQQSERTAVRLILQGIAGGK